jgi:large subunit ribosomal protein L1
VKPSAAKGRYIRTITVTTTMGPGVHVDTARTRGIVEELGESADADSPSGVATVGA